MEKEPKFKLNEEVYFCKFNKINKITHEKIKMIFVDNWFHGFNCKGQNYYYSFDDKNSKTIEWYSEGELFLNKEDVINKLNNELNKK